jgi:hypothetical protein
MPTIVKPPTVTVGAARVASTMKSWSIVISFSNQPFGKGWVIAENAEDAGS